jgi:uncharacterized protein YbjT (DUF2867 family)
MGMGGMLKDKGAGEQMLRRSDLEWTIVYASILSDGPASGSVLVLPEGTKRRLSEMISRSDVAAWMVQAASGVQHSRSAVGITGSTRSRERSYADTNLSGAEGATTATRRTA